MLPTRSTSSDASMQREHVVVEHRRQVDDHVAGDRLQRGADVHHLARQQRVGRHRLDRRGQHEQSRWPRPWSPSVCTSSMSPYCTAAAASSTVFCGGRPSITDTSPNCRSPSIEHHRLGRALRHRGGDVDRDAGLAHATLGGEHRDQAAGLTGHGAAGAGARSSGAGEQLADAVDRLVEAGLAADHDRVTGAGAQRLLEHVGRQLVDREDDAQLRVRARHPVHVLEADRAGEPGTEHRHHRPRRVEAAGQVFHRLELRGARELDREPRAQVRGRARRRRRRRPRGSVGASTVA